MILLKKDEPASSFFVELFINFKRGYLYIEDKFLFGG